MYKFLFTLISILIFYNYLISQVDDPTLVPAGDQEAEIQYNKGWIDENILCVNAKY